MQMPFDYANSLDISASWKWRKILAMNPTQKLVHAAMKAAGLTTGYQLAKRLNCSHQRVYGWINGEHQADSEALIELAEIAGVDPVPHIAAAGIANAKSPRALATWTRIAERLAA